MNDIIWQRVERALGRGVFQPKLTEQVWRAAEQNMARRERIRLIRLGRIVPAYRMKPQLMEKDANGRWCPQLEIN